MRTLYLFCKIIKYRFLSLIEYPGSFIAGIITQWISYGIDMLMMLLIVWRFGTLAGWLPAEVIFLYAVWLLTYALGASFTYNLAHAFPQMGVNGTLDEALIKPVPAMAYLLAGNYNLGDISHVTLTATAIGVSIAWLKVSWTAFEWFWLVILLISGSIIQGCLMLICEMPALRTRSESPTSVFFWQPRNFAQYPISIYPKSVQFIFMSVIPFSFTNFYPIQVLLHKNDGLFANTAKWLSPAVAVIMLGLTAVCWQAVTKGYESAGS